MLERVAGVTTAHVADACLRSEVAVRTVPVTAVIGTRVAGRVLPGQHVGSVDVFLEAFESAAQGAVLVVGSGGRRDEACVAHLVTLEAAAAAVVGIVIWGLHRDTVLLTAIGLRV